ncbi:MAG: hypothetical protein JW797_06825 [Bradymonadales bacterium]|nr:hypothetical protein [Bradymonadales bacterium]
MKTKILTRPRRRVSRLGQRQDEAHTRSLSPRETHGTRVVFHFTCQRCGKEDTLPFVPKTRGEILCRECAEAVFGKNWAHGRPVEDRTEYPIVCSRCGREGSVPFKPNPEVAVLCSACYRGEEQPDKDRLARIKKVIR